MANHGKKRILIPTQPFRTHLIPIEPLARTLREQGHEVRVATADKPDQRLAARALRLGELLVAGEDWTARPDARQLGRVLIEQGNDVFSRELYGRYFAGTAQRMAQDVMAIAEDFKPDLILHDVSAFGAQLAGEKLGIETVAADNGLGPQIAELHDATIRPVLNRIREQLGMDEEPEGLPAGYRSLITPMPRELLYSGLQVPGLSSYRRETPQRMGQRLVEGIGEHGRDYVYAMLGSSAREVTEFGPLFAHANQVTIQALSELDVDAVVAVGKGNVDTYRELAGDNVRVVEYAWQPGELKRADAAVLHGGFGGLGDALEGRTPGLYLPHFADQPENSRRVAERGLGLSVDSREATAEQVQDRVQELLDRRREFGANVSRLADQAEASRSLEEMMEQLTGPVASPVTFASPEQPGDEQGPGDDADGTPPATGPAPRPRPLSTGPVSGGAAPEPEASERVLDELLTGEDPRARGTIAPASPAEDPDGDRLALQAVPAPELPEAPLTERDGLSTLF